MSGHVSRLKRQYADALSQIDDHLEFWPKFLVHKNKQRLTKITQFLIRMRKLATKTRTKLVPLATRLTFCCFHPARPWQSNLLQEFAELTSLSLRQL